MRNGKKDDMRKIMIDRGDGVGWKERKQEVVEEVEERRLGRGGGKIRKGS